MVRRDEGEVVFEGRPISPRSPQQAQALGLSTAYQELDASLPSRVH